MILGPNTSMQTQHQTNASSELMFVHAKMAGEMTISERCDWLGSI